ncbi:hypothetical protein G7077_12535 [Sphingomonas piscis]|uniref:Phosphodiester glycosidase domain-containing protein n=1 Tax=Sphingomonas piscis TaxID=2714943 RepID=A0A6G7YS98_9SPHN|nr:phosphodiester glycosidase family protein [Sphingomonas piscis]QIK79609.1 hypothetical protein G7077_12535 [Sphingomonas piscis]
MRWTLLLAVLLLPGCSRSRPVQQPVSACESQSFEGDSFTVCAAGRGGVEVRHGLRSFAALQSGLGASADRVSFAMNAGMFDDAGRPIGLLVENGRQVHAINLKEGGGNFHLMPNGVFLVRDDGSMAVVTSRDYVPSKAVRFATQSGPMLVIGGKLHPRFDADGTSRYVRNGVGVRGDGVALFVISEQVVSFGKFARFFRDALKTPNALYFDGSVSSLWDPANGRMDSFTELGPMVVAFRSAASAPDRGARARP